MNSSKGILNLLLSFGPAIGHLTGASDSLAKCRER